MKLFQPIFVAVLSITYFFVPQKVQANLFRITIFETGGDVVFSFDGSIDTSGATVEQGNSGNKNYSITQRFRSGIGPFIEMAGKNDDGRTGSINNYDFGEGVTVPIFGTSNHQFDYDDFTVTGSGDPIKISGDSVYLIQNYDGSNISGEMRCAGTSLDGLNITSGTYNWGLGNNNMEIVANTNPVPGPLPILGVPVVFYYIKKLKEKTKHQ